MPARPTPASESLITAAELAAHLGVSKQTVLRGVRDGVIPAHRLGPKAIRFSLAEVLAATSGPTIWVVAPRREGMSQQARDFFYGRGGAAQPRTKKADRRSNAAGLS